MHHRINITLPEDALHVLDRAALKGGRSRFIAEAIRHYAVAQRRVTLRSLLRDGATQRAERDQLLAREWFSLDEEAWSRRRT